MSADLGDRVSDYLHHGCSDVVRTGLQAAVLTQQTADIHRMQEHLLAVIGWREQHKTGQHQCLKSEVSRSVVFIFFKGCSQENSK